MYRKSRVSTAHCCYRRTSVERPTRASNWTSYMHSWQQAKRDRMSQTTSVWRFGWLPRLEYDFECLGFINNNDVNATSPLPVPGTGRREKMLLHVACVDNFTPVVRTFRSGESRIIWVIYCVTIGIGNKSTELTFLQLDNIPSSSLPPTLRLRHRIPCCVIAVQCVHCFWICTLTSLLDSDAAPTAATKGESVTTAVCSNMVRNDAILHQKLDGTTTPQ